MTPYSGLGFFFTLALALLPAVIAGLRGKNLRVCGALVTAVMLLLIFDTPRKLLTLALFWTWQLALIFSYLHVRKRSEKRYVLWIFLLLSLLPPPLLLLLLKQRNLKMLKKKLRRRWKN